MNKANEREVRDLVSESLVWERAYNGMMKILDEAIMKLNTNLRESKKNGEEADRALAVIVEYLKADANAFRTKSDMFWEKADKVSEKHDEGYRRLADAIIERAASDYEVALCGAGNEKERKLIELFAIDGAEKYTRLDLEAVLQRIKRVHPKFVKLCWEKGKQIRDETRDARKKKRDINENTVRCPLCGRALYAWGPTARGLQTIRCCGCSFQETVTIKDED